MSNKFVKEMVKGFEVAGVMHRSGLLKEYIAGVFSNSLPETRDVYDDALRYIEELKIVSVGGENIPENGGAMLVFNHPLGDILFPGMFEVVRVSKEIAGRDIRVVVGRSSPFHNKLEKLITPWIDDKSSRFTGMFPKNAIDLSANNGDSVKTVSIKTVVEDGEILALAPTGGVDGERYPQWGAGEIAINVSEANLPIIPVAMWKRKGVIYVRIGTKFDVIGLNKEEAADKMVIEISELLPDDERDVMLRKLNVNRIKK